MSLASVFGVPVSSMAINVTAQYNGGFLPDIITKIPYATFIGEPDYMPCMRFCLRSLFDLNVLIIFSPGLGGCSEDLHAFTFLF